MSEYRQLHRSFWESGSVEDMDPVEKLLYCYLITAPGSNMEGLYKTTTRRIALETGIDRDMCVNICARLEEKHLAGFREGWVCVTQATKHMPDSPKMLAHAAALYAEAPESVMVWALGIGYRPPKKLADTVSIRYRTRLDNTANDTVSIRYRTRLDNTRLDNTANDTVSIRYPAKAEKTEVDTVLGDLRASVGLAPNKGARHATDSETAPPATCDLCGGGNINNATRDQMVCKNCGRVFALADGTWVPDEETGFEKEQA